MDPHCFWSIITLSLIIQSTSSLELNKTQEHNTKSELQLEAGGTCRGVNLSDALRDILQKTLVEASKLKNCVDHATGDTLVHIATRTGNEEALHILLKSGADLDAYNYELETPLHIAANFMNTDVGLRMVKQLIGFGANTLSKSKENKTFLHQLLRVDGNMTFSQFQDIAEYLVSKGLQEVFNVHGGSKGCTPFILAMHLSLKNATFSFLYNNGVNFNATCISSGEGAFFLALKHNRSITTFLNLVECGTDWKTLDKTNSSLLHDAVFYGNLEVVQLLLHLNGIDINGRNSRDQTALHYVLLLTKRNVLEILKELGGADFNVLDKAGRNPLFYAVKGGRNEKVFSYLVKVGVSVLHVDTNNNSLLHFCVHADNPQALRYFLKLKQLDVDGLNSILTTPLQNAVAVSHPNVVNEMVDILVGNGANVHILTKDNKSLLFLAVEARRPEEILNKCINYGVDWKELDDEKNSLLHFSASTGNAAALRYFVAKGGLEVNGKNLIGYTPLQYCVLFAEENILETVIVLQESGADFDVTDSKGRHLVHLATLGKRERKIMDQLISFGVQWKSSDHSNNSVLHHAAEEGTLDTLSYFLDLNGIPIDSKNVDGSRPLHFAARSEDKDSRKDKINLLQKHGADFNVEDNRGRSVISYAIEGLSDTSTLNKLLALVSNLEGTRTDENGNGLLHDAANYGNREGVDLFLTQLSYDPNGFNDFGETPLHRVCFHAKDNVRDIVNRLFKAGANFNAKTRNGSSVLEYAVNGGRDDGFLRDLVRLGADEKEFERLQRDQQVVVVEPKSMTSMTLMVSIVTVAVVLLCALLALLIAFEMNRRRYRLLSKNEVFVFLNGIESGDVGGPDESQIENLKFPDALKMEKSAFVLVSLIGQGHFGLVYNATMRLGDDKREVAVKIPRPGCTRDEFKTMLAELKILCYVGYHPHIVTFLGAYVGELGKGAVYIATELCSRGSLEDYLKSLQKQFVVDERDEGAGLELYEFHRFSREIASGMAHVAEKKIVHADLATRNVLLDADFRCKIGDFGLSRRLYQCEQYVKKGNEPLPWRWMAPETLSRREFTTKSDVWSYGVVLWEIYSLGRTPFPDAEWSQEFIDRLEAGVVKLPCPQFSSENIYREMERCWEVSPDCRPTFAELAQFFVEVMKPEYTTVTI